MKTKNSEIMNFNDEFSFGKVFQIIASTLALGLVIFLIVAALDYFGPNLQIPVIINIKEF